MGPGEAVPRTRLWVGDEPLPEEALALRVAGRLVAGVVVQGSALVRDLLGAVVAADDVERAGHAAVGLQLVLRVDGERRPGRGAVSGARALAGADRVVLE